MRNRSSLARRIMTACAGGALVLGASVVAVGGAQAAPRVGSLTLTPATGNESTALSASLSAPCPAGSAFLVGYLSGPQFSGEAVLQGIRSVDTSLFVSSLFKDVFAEQAVAAPEGEYTVRFACVGDDAFTETGEYSQKVVFTPRGGTNNATYATVQPGTQTTLAAPAPAQPVAQGTSVTLTATVDGGDEGVPTGSVEFKRGSTSIGSATLNGTGVATLATTALPAGTNSLTATYVPGGANALPASTSAAQDFVVAGPTTISGTAKVGVRLTCNATSGGTKTYSWTRNGAATSVTTSSVVVPSSWFNTTITCAVRTSVGSASVTRASTGVKVGLGAAPVATKKPSISGTLKVGKRLTCARGTWSPTPSSYKYQWLRGSTKLSNKTASTYITVAADKGKLISCQVTALSSGRANGVAKSAAKKIS